MTEKIPQNIFAEKKQPEIKKVLSGLIDENERKKLVKSLETEAKDTDPFISSPLIREEELVHHGKTVDHWKPEYSSEAGKIKKIRDSLYVYKDPKSENEYIKKKEPMSSGVENRIPTEQFVSLLSKGILHTSDIVSIEKEGYKKYFSRITPLENAKYPRTGEYEAEAFLLKYLFNDWDKYNDNQGTVRNIKTQGPKFALYDYSKSFQQSPESDPFQYEIERDEEKLRKNIIKELSRITTYGHTENKQGITKLFQKINTAFNSLIRTDVTNEQSEKIKKKLLIKSQLFSSALADKEFFKAVVKKSGIKIDSLTDSLPFLVNKTSSARQEELRDRLLERANILIQVLQSPDKK